MDIYYPYYTPFRNKLRKLSLESGLEHIWRYQAHFNQSEIVADFRKNYLSPPVEIYVWELNLLCKEITLNASESHGLHLNESHFIDLVNCIRIIREGISSELIKSKSDALSAIHQLGHQQIRWQNPRDEARLFRAYHIYSDDRLAPLFEQATGLSVYEIVFLGLLTSGLGKRQPRINVLQDYKAFDISDDSRNRFFELTSASLVDIRLLIKENQRYDEGWEYTWNPLESKPFIRIDNNKTPVYWFPLPELMIRRVTEGLFYDLIKGCDEHNLDAGNEFGLSFQNYIGRVLRNVCNTNGLTVTEEEAYKSQHGIKHGVDWIVSDGSGKMIIECKTKRITQAAKETPYSVQLDASLDELAKAIVQLYANINDARNGHSTWEPNGLPVYPFVITLEDWVLLTPQVIATLNDKVRSKLANKILPDDLIETMPFFVISAHEFEMVIQDINHLGIKRFCEEGKQKENRHFKLSQLAAIRFPNEPRPHSRLLETTWKEIFPKLDEWEEMVQHRNHS